MSDEKEVVSESNVKEDTKNGTNDTEAIVEETDVKTPGENDESVDLDAEILRQIEYYFGDVNLPRDRFLSDQTKLDDGWVPINVLARFNRLSKLSTDPDVIENAVKKSTSGLLEVANKKVRRNPERPVPLMTEERRMELVTRTVYVKGFSKDTSLDEILRFFKKFDYVENVVMRRYLETRTQMRLFKGSVFATFKTKEQAEQFIAQKDTIKYNDADLLIMSQEDYGIYKEEEKKDRVPRKDKKHRQNKNQPNSDKPEKPQPKLPTGSVLYFENGHDKMTREEIKTAIINIDKKLDIAFIDFKIGLTKGWVRFSQENAAVGFLAALDNGNIKIGNKEVALKLLEGDEELAYLKKTQDHMLNRRKIQKSFKKNKSYKGKQFLKRRQHTDNEDAPPAKVKCDS